MKERGIIMSAESVRATLAGLKTQTRRLAICRHGWNLNDGSYDDPVIITHPDKRIGTQVYFRHIESGERHGMRVPYEVGDKLYFKEGWRIEFGGGFYDENSAEAFYSIEYRAGGKAKQLEFHGHREDEDPYIKTYDKSSENFNSPLFMPKWAARVWVEVVSVKAERLQDITRSDAYAEGFHSFPCEYCDETGESVFDECAECDGKGYLSEVDTFRDRWNEINGKRAPWDGNPYVFAYTYKLITGVQA